MSSDENQTEPQPRTSPTSSRRSTTPSVCSRCSRSVRAVAKRSITSIRAKYEKRFGVDLGHVRVVTGEFAEEFNRKREAYAVTVGGTGMILMGNSPDKVDGHARRSGAARPRAHARRAGAARSAPPRHVRRRDGLHRRSTKSKRTRSSTRSSRVTRAGRARLDEPAKAAGRDGRRREARKSRSRRSRSASSRWWAKPREISTYVTASRVGPEL